VRNRKHQADTVFLIDLRRRKIVVNRNDVDARMHLRQLADHALAADVVRQAAKRLCADDVLIAVLGKLQHLRRQQPALAHLAAIADDALDQRFDVLKGGRRNKVRMRGNGFDERRFHPLAELHQSLAENQLEQASAVEVMILDAVVDFEENEAHDAREHVFTVLRAQEFFKPVVAQRRILDIDFADNADAGFSFMTALDGVKIIDNRGKVFAHILVGQALSAVELLDKRVVPLLNERIRFALIEFIRARLVGYAHDAVAVDQRRDNLPNERQRQLEAGCAFQTAHVDGNNRNLLKPRFLHCLTQKKNMVAGAAAAAGLGDNQGDLVDVVLAGMQRIEELTDDQQCGNAGVVMNVFQSLCHHVRAAVGQQLGVVAIQTQHLDNQGKMELKHIGHENRVARFPHFAGKFNMIAGHGFNPSFRCEQRVPAAGRSPRTANAGECVQRPDW